MSAVPAVIKIACTVDYPPFCFKSGQDVRGFHVDAICDVLKAESIPYEVTCFAWTELADLLSVGYGYGVFACGMTYTIEREVLGSFSGPWISSRSIVVRSIQKPKRDIEVLAVNQGGYLEGLARKTFGPSRLLLCDDNALLPELLVSQRASHVLTDELEFHAWRDRNYNEFTMDRVVNEQRQGLFFKDRVFGLRYAKLLKKPEHQKRILELASTYGIDHATLSF